MGWNDIERGLGVVGAIPGKIMGSVVNPLLGGLNVRGAYAAGRGNHQAAAMIREQRNQQRGMQQQQQRMAQMRSSWDNAFPDGEFNPNLPQHRSAVFEILREGYPGENPYDHWERILGLQVKFNEAQAKEHSTLQRYEAPDPSTGKTVQMWFDPATGRSGRVSDPQGQQLPGYEAEDEGEGGGSQSPAGKIYRDIEDARDLLGTLDPDSQQYKDLSEYVEAQERNFFGATGGVTTRDSMKEEFETRSSIVKDYNTQLGGEAYEMIMKQYSSIRGAYEQWVSSYNSEDGETNAQFYGIMGVTLNKILDPTSVVRESEFARLIAFQGLEGKWKTFIAQQKRGDVDPDLMADIMDAANVLALEASKIQVPRYGASIRAHERYLPDLPKDMRMQGLIDPSERITSGGFGTVPRVWSDEILGEQ